MAVKTVNQDFLKIHEAIHNKDVNAVILDGLSYPVTTNEKGLRTLKYRKNGKLIVFMEQNPNKQGNFAQRARDGEQITWGIKEPSPWIYIDAAVVEASKQIV